MPMGRLQLVQCASYKIIQQIVPCESGMRISVQSHLGLDVVTVRKTQLVSLICVGLRNKRNKEV